MSLEESINRLAAAIERLTRNVFPPPEKPGQLSIRVTAERHTQKGESTVAVDLLEFVVDVPAADGDVVKRVGAITLPDESVETFELEGKDAAEAGPFEVPQDSEVKISVVNVDDSGNESDPRVQTFVIVDTIPPAAPGELGVRVTGERTVEDDE